MTIYDPTSYINEDCSECCLPPGVGQDCPIFPGGVYDYWSVAVAGITNGTCTDCNFHNRVFVMAPVFYGSTSCSWDASQLYANVTYATNCNRYTRFLLMTADPVNSTVSLTLYIDLTFGFHRWRSWSMSLSNFDPLGPNTFDIITADLNTGFPWGIPRCNNLPTELTIEPSTFDEWQEYLDGLSV